MNQQHPPVSQSSSNSTNDTKMATPQTPRLVRVGNSIHSITEHQLTRKSDYFTKYLAEERRRHAAGMPLIETIPVPGDPSIAQHTIAYINGSWPFLWNEGMGFDYGAYAMVYAHAQVMGCPKLVEWIRRRRYEEVVEVRYSLRERMVTGKKDIIRLEGSEVSVDIKTNAVTRPTWFCPWGHGGSYQCREADNCQAGMVRETSRLVTVVVRKSVVVHYEMLEVKEEESPWVVYAKRYWG